MQSITYFTDRAVEGSGSSASHREYFCGRKQELVSTLFNLRLRVFCDMTPYSFPEDIKTHEGKPREKIPVLQVQKLRGRLVTHSKKNH
jgi:hypothetical protein